MSILTIFVVLIIVGIALYLVNRFVPMDAKIKTVLNWAVVIIVVLWILRGLGVFSNLRGVNI